MNVIDKLFIDEIGLLPGISRRCRCHRVLDVDEITDEENSGANCRSECPRVSRDAMIEAVDRAPTSAGFQQFRARYEGAGRLDLHVHVAATTNKLQDLGECGRVRAALEIG